MLCIQALQQTDIRKHSDVCSIFLHICQLLTVRDSWIAELQLGGSK